MPTQAAVQAYYGQELTGTADLKTSACCDADAVPDWLRPLLARIHPDVLARYYGCGLVCPPLLEGCRILDLGCGTGRDVYALAQLVGPSGSVVGVDMTAEQLAVAREHLAFHAEQFGYANVSFLEGTIEALEELPLEPGSFDVIVSNCVLNLSTDKAAVLRGVKRLLKPGGELYFSDVYVNRRLPDAVRRDPVLYGEALAPLVGEARFYAATYRLFHIAELEDACEDHGQAVIYRGTIPHHPHRFDLDGHHAIETGRVFPVCGNTFRMLQATRFSPHFTFIGDFSRHYGLFPGCGSSLPFTGVSAGEAAASASCC